MTEFQINPITNLIDHQGFKILCVSEIRGLLSKLNLLARKHSASVIIHTGNFGFFDSDSISKIHESYLRHIVAFSPFISEDIKSKVNQLSKINDNGDVNEEERKVLNYVKNEKLSELDLFLNGTLKFDVPVYAIHGMIEDNSVINKFKLGIYKVNNLYLIDENTVHDINATDGNKNFNITLFGLGGALNISKLFFHGTFDDSLQDEIKNNELAQKNDMFFIPTSGDPGNLWITMLQIGKLLKTMKNYQSKKLKNRDFNSKNIKDTSIRIFVSHSSPVKEPLLEHLAIYLKSDYTISNSLHFLYSSSYNELSICPTYEFFKNKFVDAKIQLLKIWKNIKSTIGILVNRSDNPNKSELLELFDFALSCFDKIPSLTGLPTTPNTLTSANENKSSLSSHSNFLATSPTTDSANADLLDRTSSTINDGSSPSSYQNILFSLDSLSNSTENKAENNNNLEIQKKINDSYYSAFQNLWHFNLCDFDNGYVLLNCNNDRINMESFSVGFNFAFRHRLSPEKEEQQEELETMEKETEEAVKFLNINDNATIEPRQKNSNIYQLESNEPSKETEDDGTTYNEEYDVDYTYEEEEDDEDVDNYEEDDAAEYPTTNQAAENDTFENDKDQEKLSDSLSLNHENSFTIYPRNHSNSSYRHNKSYRLLSKQIQENGGTSGERIRIKPYYNNNGYASNGNKFNKNKPNYAYSKSKSTSRLQNWKTLKELESRRFDDNFSIALNEISSNTQYDHATKSFNKEYKIYSVENLYKSDAENGNINTTTADVRKNNTAPFEDNISSLESTSAVSSSSNSNRYLSNGRYTRGRGGRSSSKPPFITRGNGMRGRATGRGSRAGRRGSGSKRGGSRSESSSSTTSSAVHSSID